MNVSLKFNWNWFKYITGNELIRNANQISNLTSQNDRGEGKSYACTQLFIDALFFISGLNNISRYHFDIFSWDEQFGIYQEWIY